PYLCRYGGGLCLFLRSLWLPALCHRPPGVGPSADRGRGSDGQGLCHKPDGLECLGNPVRNRSEEHTSELQSQSNIVCRLPPEKREPIAAWVRTSGSERPGTATSAGMSGSPMSAGAPAAGRWLEDAARGRRRPTASPPAPPAAG